MGRHFIIKNRRNSCYLIRDIYITVGLWATWLLLLYPLVSLLLWKFFDVDTAYTVANEKAEASFQTLMDFIVLNATIVLVLVGSYTLWSYYNQLRYSGSKNRRKNRPIDPSPLFVAKSSEGSKYVLLNQNLRYLQVDHVDKYTKAGGHLDLRPEMGSVQREFRSKSIIFNDDWEQVRKQSKFGNDYSRKTDNTLLLRSGPSDEESEDIPTILFNINDKDISV